MLGIPVPYARVLAMPNSSHNQSDVYLHWNAIYCLISDLGVRKHIKSYCVCTTKIFIILNLN